MQHSPVFTQIHSSTIITCIYLYIYLYNTCEYKHIHPLMWQLHVTTDITECNDKLYITLEYDRQWIYVIISSWLALTLTHATINIHKIHPAVAVQD